MIIRTPRLVLRPLQRADLHAMAAWPPFPDPLDIEWNWPQQLAALGTADLFFAGRALDSSRRDWTITLTHGEVVGYVHLREITPDGRARLGIGFGYPYIGQGYGYESLGALLPACHESLGIRSIVLDVRAHNVRAIRLYRRLGFGETQRWWQAIGDHTTWSILDEARYESIRQLFRRNGDRIEALCLAMSLTLPPARPGSDD
jgi:RimJ/RimL family protein N-acetyltransferase